MNLTEIKAAVEAVQEKYGMWKDKPAWDVDGEMLANHVLWLVERVETLEIFARRVSLLDPTVGLMDVHEMVADARAALSRLEGGET